MMGNILKNTVLTVLLVTLAVGAAHRPAAAQPTSGDEMTALLRDKDLSLIHI